MAVSGFDFKIYVRRYYTGNTSWGNWVRLPGMTWRSPAIAELDGALHLVVVSMSGGGGLYHGVIDASGNFTGWTLLDGATYRQPSLASNGTALCLSVLGADEYTIWYRFYTGGTWREWQAAPDGSTSDTPSVVFEGGDLHFVVRGGGGRGIWHGVVEADGSFNGWEMLDGDARSRPALAYDQATGRIYLVVQGLNDLIYYRSYYEGEWNEWTILPGSTSEGPGVCMNLNGLLVAVRGSDYYTIWYGTLDAGVFSGWTQASGGLGVAPSLS